MTSAGIIATALLLIGCGVLIWATLHFRNKCINLTHKLAESYGENNMIACELEGAKKEVAMLKDENEALEHDLEMAANEDSAARARITELCDKLNRIQGGTARR